MARVYHPHKYGLADIPFVESKRVTINRYLNWLRLVEDARAIWLTSQWHTDCQSAALVALMHANLTESCHVVSHPCCESPSAWTRYQGRSRNFRRGYYHRGMLFSNSFQLRYEVFFRVKIDHLSIVYTCVYTFFFFTIFIDNRMLARFKFD